MLNKATSPLIRQPVLREGSATPASDVIACEKTATGSLISLRRALASRRRRQLEARFLSGLSDHLRNDIGLEPTGINTPSGRPLQIFCRLWSFGL